MRRLLTAVVIVFTFLACSTVLSAASAQDFAKLDSVEFTKLEQIEEIPDAWHEIYDRVEDCLGYRAWNEVELEEVEFYRFRYGEMAVTVKDSAGESRQRMIPIKGLFWPERGKPFEIYIHQRYLLPALPHELIHLLAPHLRHDNDVFRKCV